MKWWGPEGFTVGETIDCGPGGRWRTSMRSPEGKHFDGERRLSHGRSAAAPRLHLGLGGRKGARGHETEVTVTFARFARRHAARHPAKGIRDRRRRAPPRRGWSTSVRSPGGATAG